MPSLTALQNELLADPLKRGYSVMTDDQVAASLDTVDITQSVDISLAAVEGYLLFDGTLIHLQDYLAANTTPSATRTAAAALLAVINSPRQVILQTSRPDVYAAVQAQMQILVADNLLTAQQSNDLLAMMSVTVSRAQQIGWPQGVASSDVKAARA